MSMPMPCEVPADAAYAAARDRLMRTVDALLGAEAQIVDLHRRLDAALRELAELRERYTDAHDPVPGGDGDEADPVGYTAAVGQAD